MPVRATYLRSCKNGRSDPQPHSQDKLLCNVFWQMRLSWVVLLLIYRADASRSLEAKVEGGGSCCWLQGSLLWYCIWIRWAESEEADASWTAFHLNRPPTNERTCVRKVCMMAVCLLYVTVRRRGLTRPELPPSVPFGAVEKYSTPQRRALTQIHQENCFILSLSLSLSHSFLEQRLL